MGQVQKSEMGFEEFTEAVIAIDGRTIPTGSQVQTYNQTLLQLGDLTLQKNLEGGFNTFEGCAEKGTVTICAGLPGSKPLNCYGFDLSAERLAIARSSADVYTRSEGVSKYLLFTMPTQSLIEVVEWSDPAQILWLESDSRDLFVRSSTWMDVVRKACRMITLLDRCDTDPSEAELAHIGEEIIEGIVDAVIDQPAQSRKAGRPRISRSQVQAKLSDYLREFRPDQWSIKGLVKHQGIHERSLRNIFLELFGVGPQKYFNNLRLLLIRQELQNPKSVATVSGIASRYGIYDWGRLAERYRSVYNEYPSETLNRN